jgi:hypothetical protein
LPREIPDFDKMGRLEIAVLQLIGTGYLPFSHAENSQIEYLKLI